MVQDNVNHLYLTFALPEVTEFERVNALFHSSKTNPGKTFRELDLHHSTLKSRVNYMLTAVTRKAYPNGRDTSRQTTIRKKSTTER